MQRRTRSRRREPFRVHATARAHTTMRNTNLYKCKNIANWRASEQIELRKNVISGSALVPKKRRPSNLTSNGASNVDNSLEFQRLDTRRCSRGRQSCPRAIHGRRAGRFACSRADARRSRLRPAATTRRVPREETTQSSERAQPRPPRWRRENTSFWTSRRLDSRKD